MMLAETGERLDGSFVNPDLNLYKGRDPYGIEALGKFIERSVYSRTWRLNASKPVATAVVFKGHWRIAGAPGRLALTYDQRADATRIVFTTVDAQPLPFALQKDNSK